MKENNLNSCLLLVDDDEDINFLMKYEIEKTGYVCDVVLSGQKALEVFDPKKHAAVLIDRNLPDMEGFDLLRKLKEKQQNIRAIIYSGALRSDDKQRAEELGAIAFIEKGLDLSFVEEILNFFNR